MTADPRDALRVVLLSPRNPLNIGAVARSMSNFGFSRMRVVNAYDVAYHEAKSAVNASHVLAGSEQMPTVADAVKDCTLVVGTTSPGHRVLDVPLRRLEYGARAIRDELCRGTVGLLFGSEKFGMSNDEISHCDFLMQIPTRPEHESMNLGQAAAICLYELIRDDAAAGRDPIPREHARHEEISRVTEMLIELARASGYIVPRTHASTEIKIRQMVTRLNLTQGDAQMWLGMLRQALWAARRERQERRSVDDETV